MPFQHGNTYCGSKSFKNEKLTSVIVNGATELEGTRIEHLTVNGSLAASKATMGELVVNGSASLNNSIITGDLTINGLLDASRSQLHKLIIAASEATLSGSSATDIVVRKDPFLRVQRLVLRRGTKITGSITFESGSGQVVISSDSSVKGTIKGAEIIHK